MFAVVRISRRCPGCRYRSDVPRAQWPYHALDQLAKGDFQNLDLEVRALRGVADDAENCRWIEVTAAARAEDRVLQAGGAAQCTRSRQTSAGRSTVRVLPPLPKTVTWPPSSPDNPSHP